MAKQTFTTGQVLTAAQMTSLQQTAMLGGAASAKTASYTLVAADAGTAISMSSASATTITVNTALFAAGDTVQITNLGAGVCTITAGTATVNSSASLALAQYESGTLDFTSTSAAIFIKGAGSAAAGGGMTLLSTTTLSGASTTITVASNTYNQLIAVATGITAGTAHTPSIQINSITSGYTLSIVGTRLNTYTTNGLTTTDIPLNFPGVDGYLQTGTNIATTYFLNPNDTSIKSVQNYGAYIDQSSNQVVQSVNAAIGASAVISSIVYKTNVTFTGGTVLVYGVK